MPRFYAFAVLCFICALVVSIQSERLLHGQSRIHRYNCFQKLDGSVYCYAEDGHLFRPRFDQFVIETQ